MRASVACAILALGLPLMATLGPVRDAAATPPAQRCATFPAGNSTISGVVNSYAEGIGDVAAGSTVLGYAGATAAFAVGDRVMVMQVQDATIVTSNDTNYGAGTGTARGASDVGGSGLFELRTVTAVTASQLTVTPGVTNSYRATDTLNRKSAWQIVRVPRYRNATLSGDVTPLAWNGVRGGVVAFNVLGTLNLNGFSIHADGLGFRPGLGTNPAFAVNQLSADYRSTATNGEYSEKGEGIAGTPDVTYAATSGGYEFGSRGRGAPGNAGGGGNNHNAGGGGGGARGPGGQGGNDYFAARTVGGVGGAGFVGGHTRAFMGGGGGAGHRNEAFDTRGGAGGGVVVVTAGSWTGTGAVRANGAAGNNHGAHDGGGGGGGGGSVVLSAETGSGVNTITLRAGGGNGASVTNNSGPGGGGGGGSLAYYGTGWGSVNVPPGASGLMSGSPYGATAGTLGASSQGSSPRVHHAVECDFGDAPASYGSASHEVTQTPFNGAVLRIGSSVDAEAYYTGNAAASVDDTTGVADEDGIGTPPALVQGQPTYSITVPVQNGSAAATLVGWVDFNRDGVFDASEGTTAEVPVDANSATLTWTGQNPVAGQSYIRLRLAPNTTDIGTSSATGHLVGGEVEDHPVTIGTSADLAVTKSAPATADAGTNITYTMTVTNNGPGSATGVTLTDTLPAGTTFVSAASPNCPHSNGVVTCTIGSLAVGQTATRQITVNIPAGTAAGTVITNTASVSATEPDPTPGNNSANASTTVGRAADVSLAKSAPATARGGETFTYTLTATNAGPSDSASVVITDTLPTSMVTFSSASAGCTHNAGTVTCDMGALAAGTNTSATITVLTRPDSTFNTPITNGATVTATSDSTSDNNTASATSYWRGNADLVATKSGPATVNAGENITYTIGVTNSGTSVSAMATLTDVLPPGVTFVSASEGCAHDAGTVTCTTGTGLTVNETRTFSIVVSTPATMAAGTTLSNTVTVSSNTFDPNAANNTSAAVVTTVTTSADLAITKSGPATVNAGQQVTYTIDVTNNGPSQATSVVVTDPLPAGLTFASASAGCSHSGGTVTCSPGTLAVGASSTITIVATVGSGVANGSTITNTASVTSAVSDPTPGNNTAGTATTATTSADLALTKSAPETATAGGALTYTLTLTNNGPSDAVDTVISDPLPTGTVFTSASAGCVNSSGTVTCSIGTLAAGATVTRAITVAVQPSVADGTVLANIATATTSTEDPVPANNTSNAAQTTVAREADVTVAKSGPASVTAGTQLAYTFTVNNSGPSDAANVTVTDPLPAGTSFVTGDGGCSESGGTITCSIGTVAAGGSATRSVTLLVGSTVAAGTTISNTATIATTTTESNSANNTSNTVDTTVTASTDLTVVKSAPVETTAGTTATFTLTVTNNGPSRALGVAVADTLPAGTTFASATAGCTDDAGTVTCSIGTLEAGASTTRTITVNVDAGVADGTVLSNTATVSSTTTDPTPGNNTSNTTSTTVRTSADVTVSKAAPATGTVGTQVAYTLTVTNNGPSVARSATVTDELPPGTALASADPGCTDLAGTITCTLGDLAVGATVVRTLTVDTDPALAHGTVLSNSAAVTTTTDDPVPSNNTSSTVTTTLSRSADLEATKSGPATATAGTNYTYTLGVTNNGPSVASSVTLTDTLPAGTTFVEGDAGCSAVGATVTCTVGDLTVGASASRSVTVALATGATPGSVLSNTVTAAATEADPAGADNTAPAVETTVAATADVTVAKSGPATATAGEQATYTLTIANAGPSDAAGVTVTDALPGGTTFASASAGCTEDDGTVTCAIGTVAAGATTTRTIIVDIDTSVAHGTVLANTAVVATSTPESDDTNNASAVVSTTVEASADLAVAKSGPATATAGTELTYTLTVTNDGPSDAVDAAITDALPAGTTFVSGDAGCAEDGGTVTCTLGTLAAGATTIRTITVLVAADVASGTGLVNVANVIAATADPDPTNNTSAPVTTTVATSADVAIVKTGPASATAGEQVTYTFTVNNAGPSDALDVVVVDVLPGAVRYDSGDAGCTETDGVVTCTIGTLAAGATATRSITVTVLADTAEGATVDNTATVSSTTSDPDATNNTSGTVSSGVVTVADLAVTASAAGIVTAGTTLDVTFTVTNLGPSDAQAVVVTETLPPGTTLVSGDAGCTEDGGVVTCPIGTLAAGVTTSRTFTILVDPSVTPGSTITNTATVATTTTDPEDSNDTASAATTVEAAADLRIAKSGPATATAGTTVSYTLTVTNDGPSDAVGVKVTDTLDAALAFVEAGAGCAEDDGTVTCDLGTLAPGATATRTITATVNPSTAAGTVIPNIAGVDADTDDPDPTDNTSTTVETTIEAAADVAATKSGDTTVIAGEQLTYTLTATNTGPSDALDVIVTDTLPPGTTLASATAGCTVDAGTVACDLGTLAAGATWTGTLVLDVAASVPDGTVLTNTATVATSTPDTDGANDTTGPVETTVGTRADLGITKSGPATAIAGTTATYTIEVTNDGPSDAVLVSITDALPAGTTFVSATLPCSEDEGTVTCTAGTVAAGASTTLEVTVAVDADLAAGTELTNSVAVASATDDPDATDDTATATTTVLTSADVSVAKAAPATAVAGAPFTYTITVDNAGPSHALDVTVTDELPAGTTFVSATNGCTEDQGTVTCTIGAMADGASATVTITVVPDAALTAGTELVNTAAVTTSTDDPDEVNNSSAAAVTTITTSADLAITKSGPATATAGEEATYTLTVTNAGPSDALDVTTTDELPEGTTFTGGDTGCVAAGRTVTCSLGTLAAGAATTVSFTALLDTSLAPGTPLENSAIVQSATADPDATDNTSNTVVTTVATLADLAVAKSAPATTVAGTELTFTITVTNAGPSNATDVVVTDPLPAGTRYSYADAGCDEDDGVVTCALGTLVVGATATRTITVDVDPALDPGTLLANTATVGSATPEAAPIDNTSDTTLTEVQAAADLSISKSGPTEVTAGDPATYTLTITNAGPSDARGVAATDVLPAGMTLRPGGDCTATDGTVTCPVGTLSAGATATVTFDVDVDPTLDPAAELENTATVAADTADPEPGDNTSTAPVARVGTSADISVTKSAPATATAGTEFDYTLTIDNAGPSEARDLVLTDQLPTGAGFVSADADCAEDEGTVTCTVGTLAPGATTTRTIRVLADAAIPDGAVLANSATVAASTPDPDPTDNTSETVNTSFTTEAALSVTKSGPATVVAGTAMTYVVTVANAGPSDALAVTVTDALPAGTTPAELPTGCTADAGTVTCDAGTVAAGATWAVAIPVVVDPTLADGTVLTNTATVATTTPDPDPADDTSEPVTTTVEALADLSATKAGPATATAGTELPYSITVTNAGPSDALDVVVTDTLPAGLTFAAGDPACVDDDGVVTCTLGTLAAGETRTLAVAALVDEAVPDGTVVSNTATVTASTTDPDPTGDTSDAVDTTIDAVADLAIDKAGPATITAGTTATYTLTVTNAGPSTAVDVVTTDLLPPGTTWRTGDAGCVESDGIVACAVAVLAVGATTTFTFTVDVDTALAEGSEVLNTATVSSATTDPDPADNTSGTVTSGVITRADLAADKSGPVIVTAGTAMTYVLTVTNAGPSDAVNVVLTDTLPSGTAFASGPAGCSAADDTVTCEVGTVAAGATASRIITVDVDAAVAEGTVLSNTVTASSATTDPDPGNDTSGAVETTVEATADLSVTKSAPTEVTAGTTMTYTFEVTNAGPSDALDVVITDVLPAGVTLDLDDGSGDPGCSDADGTVTCDLGTVAAGATRSVTITVAVDAAVPHGSILTNVAAVATTTADPDAADDVSAAVATLVSASADLAVTKAGPATGTAGDPLTYTITVTNAGPSDAVDASITDLLPAGTTVATLDDGCVDVGGAVVCELGTLPAGATVTRSLVLDTDPSLPDGTVITNVASVDAATADPAPADNTAPDVVTTLDTSASLSVTKSAPATAVAGEEIDYTIVVTNGGPSDALAVVLTDVLPDGLTFVSGTDCSAAGSAVTCDLGTLAAGDARTVVIATAVSADVADGTVLTNTAAVATTTPDPDSADDVSAEVATTISTLADLAVTKSGPAVATAGTTAGYTIAVTNAGPSDALDVVVTDLLEEGLTLVAGTVDGGPDCGIAGAVVSCNLGTLPAGGVRTVALTVALDPGLDPGSTITNTAIVATTTVDPVAANDTSNQVTTGVVTEADLAVVKDGPDELIAGTAFPYTVSVTNAGPSEARDVVVTDLLPDGLTFESGSDGCGAAGATVTCPIGTVAVGATATVTFTVFADPTLDPGATIANRASVDSSTTDPDPGDDLSPDTIATVLTTADLAVTKTGPAEVTGGTTMTYSVEVANAGPSEARDVVVTDELPAGTSFVAGAGCSAAGAAVTCDLGTVATGATATATLTVMVDPSVPAGTVLANTAGVASSTTETSPADNTSGTVETVVVAEADLALDKTGPAVGTAGTTIDYTLTVTNAGPSDAVDVVVTDVLPEGTAFTGSTDDCTADGATVTCRLGTLADGATGSVTFTVALDPTLDPGTVLENLASVASDATDPNPADDVDVHETTVTATADVSATKSGPATVTAGTTLEYVLTANNAGPSEARDTVLTDLLPAGLTWVSGDADCSATGALVTCDLGTLAVGATATRSITVAVDPSLDPGAIVTNTVTASTTTPDPEPGNDTSDPVATTVETVADVAAAKSGPVTMTAGTTADYVLTATNAGPSEARDTVLTDLLPSGLTWVSGDTGCSADTGTEPAVVTCELGTVAPGATVERTITVAVDPAVPAGTVITNTVTVSTGTADPVADNDTSAPVESVVLAVADLAVTKAGPADATAGTTFPYSLTVTNAGPSDAVDTVVTDLLPSGLSFVSGDAGCSAADDAAVTCALGTVAAGATVIRTFIVAVDPAVADGTVLTNTATVASTTPDPVAENDTSDPVDTTVAAVADLAITKTGPETATAGTEAQYTLTVVNNGPSDALGVVVVDVLPIGLVWVSGDAACAEADGTVVCSLGTLAMGDTRSVTFTVRVDAALAEGDTVPNTASVSSDTADPNPSDNTSGTDFVVATSADLAVTKSGPSEVVAGTTATYVVTVTNAGPSDALAVTVTDPLPAGTSFRAGSAGCTDAAGTVTCSLGTLAAGATASVTITVDVDPDRDPGSSISNTASVSSDTADPDPADDTSESVTSEVATRADLAITKSGAATITAGTTTTYTVTVSNAGPSDARDVTVTDVLPDGLSWVSGPDGCSADGPTVTCAMGTLAVGEDTSRTFVVAVSASLDPGATVANVATVTSSTEDPDPTNATSMPVTGEVTTLADLSIAKSGPAVATAGTEYEYTVTVTNAGPSDARDVVVADVLTAGLAFVSSDDGCTAIGPAVSCPLGTLTAGGSATVAFTVLVDAAVVTDTVLENVASVSSSTSDPVTEDDTSEAVATTVTTSADLAITKAGPMELTAGDPAAYTVTVTNAGPSDATAVTVTDVLPAGLTLVGGTVAGDPVPCADVDGTVVCELGGLPLDGTIVLTLDVVVDSELDPDATRVNVATVDSDTPDPDPSDNTAASIPATVVTLADLAVTKTGPAEVTAGTTMTYSVSVSNAGPSAARDVVITDQLPAGATFDASDAGCTATAGVVTCDLETVPVGDSVTVDITVAVDPSLDPGATISNVAAVSASTADPTAGDNTSDAAVTLVTTSAALSIAKVGPPTAVAGTTGTYAFTITNAGPSDAREVVITDLLPDGVTLVSGDDGCGAVGATLTCDLGTLAAGAAATREVTVGFDAALPEGAEVVNTAAVASTTSDPDASDDTSAPVTTTIETIADLAVTKAGPATATAGGTAAYVVTVHNAGPSDAVDVAISDVLPAGTSYASGDPACAVTDDTVSCPVALLAAGANHAWTFVVALDPGIPEGTVLVNTAAVTSATPDDDLTDNVSDPVETVVGTVADLAITKAGPAAFTAGTEATYTLTVTNHGISDARDVVATDVLPAGLTWVSGDAGCSADGGTVTCALGTIAADTDRTVSFRVVVDAAMDRDAVVTNTATVASTTVDPVPANNASSTDAIVETVADLEVDKAGPATLLAGGTGSYVLTVRNDGPSDALDVTVTDVLPDGLTLLSGTGCSALGSLVGCTLGRVAAGATTSVALAVAVDPSLNPGDVLTNTASVASATMDPDPANDVSAPVASTVVTSADLSVAKSGPATVTAGTEATYTFVVANAGPSDARDVALVDVLPAGVSFVAGDPGCVEPADTPGTVVCTVGTLAAGTSTQRSVTVVLDSGLEPGSTVVNTVSATSSTPDPDPTDDVSEPTTATVGTEADLSITKAGPATATAGTGATYTVTVTNSGPSEASGVEVADLLPAGLSFTGSGDDCTAVDRVVECRLGTIPEGGTATASFDVLLDADLAHGATLVNTATVSSDTPDPDPTDDVSAPVTTTVGTSADLAVTKSGPATVTAGTNAAYTVTITNHGPSTARSVVLMDPLPAGFTFVSADRPCAVAAGTVTCTLGALAAGDSLVTGIVMAVSPSLDPGAVRINAVTVSSSTADPDPANNTAAAAPTTITTLADLSIAKAGADTVVAGTRTTYRITVTNAGPSDARDVVVTDTLPSGMTFVGGDAGCSAGPPVTCPVGTVPVGTSRQVDIEVLVDAALEPDTTLTNVASAESSTPDPDGEGPASDPEVSTVATDADLEVTKSGPAEAVAGEDLTYTVTIRNLGPSTAVAPVLTDTLPEGLTHVSADPACTNAGGTVTCRPADLPAGGTWTGTITARAAASLASGAVVTNTAAVSADTPDPRVDNNASAPVATTFRRRADLSVTKSGPAQVVAGSLVTYDLTASNAGPSDATGVVLADPLPAGTSVAALDPGCVLDATTVRCTVGNLARGAQATRRLVLSVNPAMTVGSTLTNTASVSATTPEVAPADNTASTSATVSGQADVYLSKTIEPTVPVAGRPVTYIITVGNTGPSVARDVVVTDPLPAGFVPDGPPAGCSMSPAPDTGGLVTCPVGTLAVGEARTFRLTGRAAPTLAPGDRLVNVASVSSTTPDPDPSDNSNEPVNTPVDTANNAEVAIEGPDGPLRTGAVVDLVVTVRNTGAGTVTNLRTTQLLPPALTGAVVEVQGGPSAVRFASGPRSASTPICFLAEGRVECALPSLAPAGSFRYLVRGTVDADLATGRSLDSTVVLLTGTTELSRADNSTAWTAPVVRSTDLSVTKSVDRPSATVGDPVRYEIVVRNGGPDTARDVRVLELLPAELRDVRMTTASGWYESGEDAWVIPSLAAGESATLVVRAVVGSSGSVVNTVRLEVLGESAEREPAGEATAELQAGDPSVAPSFLAYTGSAPSVFAIGASLLLVGLLLAGLRRRSEEDEDGICSP